MNIMNINSDRNSEVISFMRANNSVQTNINQEISIFFQQLKKRERSLLAVIINFLCSAGKVECSQEYLGKEIGLKLRQTHKLLNRLKRFGLLQVIGKGFSETAKLIKGRYRKVRNICAYKVPKSIFTFLGIYPGKTVFANTQSKVTELSTKLLGKKCVVSTSLFIYKNINMHHNKINTQQTQNKQSTVLGYTNSNYSKESHRGLSQKRWVAPTQGTPAPVSQELRDASVWLLSQGSSLNPPPTPALSAPREEARLSHGNIDPIDPLELAQVSLYKLKAPAPTPGDLYLREQALKATYKTLQEEAYKKDPSLKKDKYFYGFKPLGALV